MMKDFTVLPQDLQSALTLQNITTPTPIQAQAIPPAMEGKDVLGTAQTGTGKTFAFLLPILARMAASPEESDALVLAPTRELAQQTYDALKLLKSADCKFKAALVIGGESINRQFADLRKKPRFIIATPGRVIDHMQRKTINLKNVHFLVMDETDRMLDMGFIEPIKKIVSTLPQPRQTLLFSATMPKEITELAKQFLKEPVRIKIGSVSSPIDLVSQEVIYVGTSDKVRQLVHELNTRQGSVLVFVKTKHGADRLAKQLKLYGQKVNAIHGDLRQNRRKQVLEDFRNESVRVLVATDVAARGIDVPHIAHVVNYDLPQCPEDYIHRIGRTGRAGAVGCAVSFIAGDEGKWRDICRSTKFSVPVKTVTKTSEPLPEPKFVAEEEPQSGRNGSGRNGGGRGAGRNGGGRSSRFGGRSEGRSSRDSRSPRAASSSKDHAQSKSFSQPAVAVSLEAETQNRPSRSGRPLRVRTFHKAAEAEQVLQEAAQSVQSSDNRERELRAATTDIRLEKKHHAEPQEGGERRKSSPRSFAREGSAGFKAHSHREDARRGDSRAKRGESRSSESMSRGEGRRESSPAPRSESRFGKTRSSKPGQGRFAASSSGRRTGSKPFGSKYAPAEKDAVKGGFKVARVGASKSGLRDQIDTTVESVKRKFRKIKQNGFSKFFKHHK